MFGIVRSVSPTADAAALIAASGPAARAGVHLRTAWASLYGLRPDPGTAYREAVRAVEAAARPVLTPSDKDATLGKMLGARRTGAKNFTVRLDGDTHNDSRDTMHAMMAMLHRSQLDRHGTDQPDVPFSVSADEADAAVFLAITLVQYFQAGHIRRRDS